MKKVLFSLIATLLVAGSVIAAPIYSYYNDVGGTPTFTNTNLSFASNLTAVGATSATPCAQGFSGISGFTATSFSTSNPCVEVKLVANTGYKVHATQFNVGMRRSGTGPDKVRFAYSTDGGSTWTTGTTDYTPTNGSCATTVGGVTVGSWNVCVVSDSLIFRIYPYNASGSGGTFQIFTMDVQGYLVDLSTYTAPSTAAGGPTTFCSGDNVMLSATYSPTSTYQWYNGATPIFGATNSSYTARFSGNYSVVMTGVGFCNYTSTPITVTVVNPPFPPTITPTGTRTICSNDSVVISGPSGYTYQWYDGASAVVGATNQTYAARTSGNYRLQIANSTGCTSTSFGSLRVTTIPAPTDSVITPAALAFCSGGSLTLQSAAPATGNTFRWYSSGTPIAGATSQSHVVNTSGTYSVRVTATNGCISDSRNYLVSEIASPSITASGATVFCAGGSARLSSSIVTGATGVTYQWWRDTTAIAGANTTSYTATSSGVYTVQIRVAGICSASSNTIRVIANPLPNPVVSFDGRNVRTGSYYRTYQWYLNTVTIPGATSSTTPVRVNGSYRVYVTDTNGCSKLSGEFPVVNLAVSNVNTAIAYTLLPNPATNTINISNSEDMIVTITSADGRKELQVAGGNAIDIANLPAGMHLVQLTDKDGNKVYTEKLIKQ